MFLILLGAIAGFFSCFVLFIVIILTGIKFDASVATNIIVAVATVIATAIHYSSIRQQRKDRLWDINKTVLLELSHSLSKVIEASEYYLQEEFSRYQIDEEPQATEAPNSNVFKEFKEKQEYALNVYKTLMSHELINSLKEAKRINENIEHGVNFFGVDHITAYEESIETYKKLQEKLDFFIAKISGINYI